MRLNLLVLIQKRLQPYLYPPLLNDELNGFYKRYSISSSTLNALVQPLMAESDIQLAQILNGVVRLAKSRPELSQLITTLFSNMDMYLAEEEPRLAAARRSIEQWFNDAMDRAGGWYKRHTQLWLGMVGFCLALMLNVDTVTIATVLWRDPILRQNVVEQAQKYQISSATEGTPIVNPDEAATAIRDLNAKLGQDLLLPIGWHTEVHILQSGESCTLLPQRSGDIWGLPNKVGCIQLQNAVPNTNTRPISMDKDKKARKQVPLYSTRRSLLTR